MSKIFIRKKYVAVSIIFYLVTVSQKVLSTSILLDSINNFTNPAELAFMVNEHRSQFGYTDVRFRPTYKGTLTGGLFGPNGKEVDEQSKFNIHLPYFETVSRWKDSAGNPTPVVLGCSIDTPYFTDPTYSFGQDVSAVSTRVNVRTTWFNMKMGVKIADRVSLGFGVGPAYTTAGIAGSTFAKKGSKFTLIDSKAQNWAGNAGIFYMHSDNKTFMGLSYHLKINTRLLGVSSITGPTPLTPEDQRDALLCKEQEKTGITSKLTLPYLVKFEALHLFPKNWVGKIVVGYAGLKSIRQMIIRNTVFGKLFGPGFKDAQLLFRYINSWEGLLFAQKTFQLKNNTSVAVGANLGIMGAPLDRRESLTAFMDDTRYMAGLYIDYRPTKTWSILLSGGTFMLPTDINGTANTPFGPVEENGKFFAVNSYFGVKFTYAY